MHACTTPSDAPHLFRCVDCFPTTLSLCLQVDHQLDTPAVIPGQAPTTLPTVFRLGAHCDYGERYGLLGSVEQLGNWDPAKAVPMQVGASGMPAHAHAAG